MKKCKRCNKLLSPFREQVTAANESRATKIKEHGRGIMAEAGTWRTGLFGRFGYDGNGYFCSLRCGFYWAVRVCRDLEGETSK